MTIAVTTDDAPKTFLLTAKNASGQVLGTPGHPGGLSAVPVWTSSNADVLTVSAAADGFSAVVTFAAAGTAFVRATAGTLEGRSDDIVVTLGPSAQAASLEVTLAPAA